MKRILITGASGFLGSHIVEESLNRNYAVYCLMRTKTDISRVAFFQDRVTWINIEEPDWKQSIINANPEILIHTAWSGVGAAKRMEWDTQLSNLNFLIEILEVATQLKNVKFISFGSQAEYGLFSEVVKENFPTKPTTAYGAAKLASSVMVEYQCKKNDVNWYWLRLFSFFGEREGSLWFMPTVINSLLEQKELKLTSCEQVYAYMYVKDLASLVCTIAESDIVSGIYNVCSKEGHSLKKIVERIIEIIQPEFSNIQFGAIPYRDNQPMHIQGDISKLLLEVPDWKETNFDEALKNSIEYFMKLKEKKSNGKSVN